MDEERLKQIVENSELINETFVFNNTTYDLNNVIKDYFRNNKNIFGLNPIIDFNDIIESSDEFSKITKDLKNEDQKKIIESHLNKLLILFEIYKQLQATIKINISNSDLDNTNTFIKSNNYKEYKKNMMKLNTNFTFESLKELCSKYNISLTIFVNEYNTNEEFDNILEMLANNFRTKIFVNGNGYKYLSSDSYDLKDIDPEVLKNALNGRKR